MTLPQWQAEAQRQADVAFPGTDPLDVARRDVFVLGYLQCRAVMDEPAQGSVVKLWTGVSGSLPGEAFNVAYRVTTPAAREAERWMINGHLTSWSYILLTYTGWTLMTDA